MVPLFAPFYKETYAQSTQYDLFPVETGRWDGSKHTVGLFLITGGGEDGLNSHKAKNTFEELQYPSRGFVHFPGSFCAQLRHECEDYRRAN